jgi:uncharacterized protein with FMN-binding domain
MRKLLVFAVFALIFGSIIYQKESLLLLKIISSGSGSPAIASRSISSNTTPPYKDGTYTGNAADAFYGNIKVQVVISGGKITDVVFLEHPSEHTRSVAINTIAMPNLKQEAIQAQSANVNVVSGATDSSNAFIQSLASALVQAK